MTLEDQKNNFVSQFSCKNWFYC